MPCLILSSIVLIGGCSSESEYSYIVWNKGVWKNIGDFGSILELFGEWVFFTKDGVKHKAIIVIQNLKLCSKEEE